MKRVDNKLLSLRVNPVLAKAFKIEAAERGLRQNQLFEEIVSEYLKKNKAEKKTE